MMKVIQFGDPRLRQSSTALSNEEIVGKEAQTCAKELISILKGLKAISSENGNGIAAPQIGKTIRLIGLYYNNGYYPLFNPTIIEQSSKVFDSPEECFSFYNLRAPVSRHQTITLSFQDQYGNIKQEEFSDELSALVQHEIDHLNGVLFIDRIQDMSQLSSIEYVLKDNPNRLAQVKQMIEYLLS